MKKHILKFIIGIPILILIFVVVLSKNSTTSKTKIKDFNPYLNAIPKKYALALNNSKHNDSTFFTTAIEDFSIRELLIFKTNPNDKELKTDFVLELYPSHKKHLKGNSKSLTFNIIKDAVLFNDEYKTYGVFKLALPLIDIEKLVIKTKIKTKKDTVWEYAIIKPFASVIQKEQSLKLNDYIIEKTPMLFTSLFNKQLKEYEIKYLPSSLNRQEHKVARFYKPLSAYISSNKATLVKVVNPTAFWKKINTKDKTLLKDIEIVGSKSDATQKLFNKYLDNGLSFNTLFEVEKLAMYHALKPVFVENCLEKTYFIFNEANNILEPFHTFSECPNEKTLRYLTASEIDDADFIKIYAAAINKVSSINIYETLINNNNAFKDELVLINHHNPNHIFNYDILRANQKVANKSLNPSSALKSELISIDNNKLVLSVFNTSNYTIDVLNLRHNKKKTITSLDPYVQIARNEKDTITIDLPRSFENLFVSKKKKATGFVLPKHIYDLGIQYRISGVSKTNVSSIIPYQKGSKNNDDLFRTAAYINNHKYISVDEVKKEISFSKDSVVVSAPLIIQKGYTFKLDPGTIVNIIDGGKIISHSPLNFVGTIKTPIKVYSSDTRGQGLLVLSEQRKSILKHVIFDQLRNPTHGSWGVTGSVTFYESPVNLEYVSVKNNKCEDALNIVRTTFAMSNVTISNTQSDAFDGDFVKGSILNCRFNNLGNDAIDVSGSDLTIKNVIVSNAFDKGLSAGENSKMYIDNVEISNSEIAVAGKDLSVVIAKNLKILKTKLGFTAFQKKPEFGPSQITVAGITMTDIETKYLIESSSSLIVDNEKIKTTQNVKDRMYGVEFGRSSAETRNTPK